MTETLRSLIEKYAPYKVLKVTFEGEGVKEEMLKNTEK